MRYVGWNICNNFLAIRQVSKHVVPHSSYYLRLRIIKKDATFMFSKASLSVVG